MSAREAPPREADPPASRRASSLRDRLVAFARSLVTVRDLLVARRSLLAPMAFALIPLFWVVDATQRSVLTTLGRDQGIFQYIAWAITQGDVDYRDVRDVNGPLVHLVHLVFLKLGGADEHRFHVLDILASSVAFAFVGACLPGLGRKAGAPPSWLDRVGWAFAAWVALMGQYQIYFYWNQAQRESFCDWFLLPSLALQLAWPPRTDRAATLRVAAVGALSVITWYGKPSFVFFTAAQALVLLFDTSARLGWKKRLGVFAAGGAVGSLPPLAFLFARGDAAAFARIAFKDVPAVYRFIWAKSPQEILGEDGAILTSTPAVACTVVLLALVATGTLPRRALAAALFPLAALANVLAQRKGFGYHFHPLTASTWIGWLIVVLFLWERHRSPAKRRPWGRYLAIGAACGLGLELASSMRTSPHIRNVWILAGGETAERRTWKEYFDTFKTHDFYPWEMRQTAAFLGKVTGPNDRVQTYGMDPYVLFLARRLSATPYVYAYDLNADAALDGGWTAKPTDAEAAVIRQKRDEHEADMLAKLKAKPPPAFVFIDKSPLITYQNALEDFQHTCPTSAAWVQDNYYLVRTYGEYKVWLRNDVPRPPDDPKPPEPQ